jgi:hypothetical protein
MFPWLRNLTISLAITTYFEAILKLFFELPYSSTLQIP